MYLIASDPKIIKLSIAICYTPPILRILVTFHLGMDERLTQSLTFRTQVSSPPPPPPPQQQQHFYCYFQVTMIFMNNKSGNWKGTF